MSKLTAAPGFLLLLGGMILVLDPAVSAAVLLSALIHECGHLLAIRLCGGRLRRLRLGLMGAAIGYDGRRLSYGKEALCALAGPLANLLFALLFSISGLYTLAGTGLVEGGLNLIPARRMDGGRAIYMLSCGKHGMERAERQACVLSCVSAFILLGLGLYVAIKSGRNFTLLLLGLWLLLGECRLTKRH